MRSETASASTRVPYFQSVYLFTEFEQNDIAKKRILLKEKNTAELYATIKTPAETTDVKQVERGG